IKIQIDAVPPERTRQLGRPRRYTATDMPARMHNWHAPRANRWEHVFIVAGRMDTQWLGAAGVIRLRLEAGKRQWIAPGNRWRVEHASSDLRFEFKIHADETIAADAPQVARAALFDELASENVREPSELETILGTLSAGELLLLRAHADCGAPLQDAMRKSGKTLFWHPLEAGSDRFTALVARSSQPVGLPEYLGRDHAVIEATLSGALRGNTEHTHWM